MKYILSRKLFESKKTEKETINLLDKNGIKEPNNVLEDLKNIDKSENQILLPSMAYFYLNGIKLDQINQTFSKMPELLDNNMIKNPERTKKGVKIEGQTYNDFLKFSEFVDAAWGRYQFKQKLKKQKSIQKEDTIDEEPIWTGNNIEIYAGKDVGSCIKLGKNYSFCISKPGNTMYQSYRDTKISTFYFIFDKNKSMDDPLHIVVFDNTKHGVELTDATNSTGSISEYGSDVDGYIDYLESKGVPVDKVLINKPKDEKEKEEDRLLGNKNEDLDWFIKLSDENKSKYIGRGHNLSDNQFNYIIEYKMDHLLRQYVTIGNILEEERVKKLKEYSKNILKSYLQTIAELQETEHKVDLTQYPETYINMVRFNYITPKNINFNIVYNTMMKDNMNNFEMFLEKGFNPDSKDNINQPILVLAIQNNKKEYVEKLLEKGADPNIIDEDIPFATPKGWAEKVSDNEMVNILIKHGAE